MAYDAEKSPELFNELERPKIKRLLRRIQECGVAFNVCLKTNGEIKFTCLVGRDKKKVAIKNFLKHCESVRPK